MRLVWRAMLGAVLVVGLVIGGTAFRVWQVGTIDDRHHADVIAVMGAAQYDGRPSSVLTARLEHARELYQQKAAPAIATLGGRRIGDNYTEAQAGQQWLAMRGVPESRIVPIGEGDDTLNSAQALVQQAHERGWHTAVLVSDPEHVFRVRTMVNDLGLTAWASPADQSPAGSVNGISLRYLARETGGMLYYRLFLS